MSETNGSRPTRTTDDIGGEIGGLTPKNESSKGFFGRVLGTLGRFLGAISGYVQIGVIAVLLIVTFYFTRAPTQEDIEARSPGVVTSSVTDVQLVSVVRPLATVSVPKVNATGSVLVRSYVTLTSQVGGRVTYVAPSMRSGGVFGSGEELLRIDRRDFDLNVQQTGADFSSAQATLELREAERDVAIDNYHLLNPGADVPTLVAKEPQIRQAKAQLASARARMDSALLALKRSQFTLPFDGRVTESTVEVGQYLTPGQAFGRAFAENAVEISVPVTVDEQGLLGNIKERTGQVLANGSTYPVRIDRVAAELDQQTRFSRIYLQFVEDRIIPPGTFVEVEIEGMPLSDTYRLSESARQMNDTLWLVRNGQLALFKPELLASTPDGLIVRAFDYGEGIILGTIPGAREGLEVQISELDL